MKTLQNFFKTTIPTAWAAGTGNRYVTTLPTPTSGWLVTSPNNASLREIVRYTATGTDGGGNYITIAERGIGGTTDQTHAVNETVRMDLTAEHWADIYVDPVFTGDVTVPTPTNGTDAVTKDYADGLAIAGAPDATTSTKGITKMSVAPVSAASPIAVGDNDGRVPTQSENDALVGNNTDVAVGTGNKFITQTGLQHGAELYAADAGANDTYVITLAPVPTSYTTGMVIRFKANTVNTGVATLNVNSLGAKTIVKGVNTTLADGDIAAGQFCTVIYDGTNFVLQNPAVTTPILTTGFKNGVSTVATNDTTTDVITHSLGVIPKRIRIDAIAYIDNGTGQIGKISSGSYDSSGQSSVSNATAGSGTDIPISSTTYAMIYANGGAVASGGAIGTVTSTQFTVTITGTVSNGKFKYHWEVEG